MVVGMPSHVRISIRPNRMLFDITYKPDTEYVFVESLNLSPDELKRLAEIDWNFKNLKPEDQIEVYTGNLRLHGIFFIGNQNSPFEKTIARTLLIPIEEDSRFAYLKYKIIEMVTEKEYDMWTKFDSSTRLIDREKELFDMTILLFRRTVLGHMITEVDFLKNLTDHKQFEWKEIDYSKDNSNLV
jgi:hypothetical protein